MHLIDIICKRVKSCLQSIKAKSSISPQKVEGYFSVTFHAFSNGRKFFIDDVRGDDVVVIIGDEVYAKEHGFHPIERPLWINQIHNENFDEFQMTMHNVKNGEEIVTKLDWSQMQINWTRYKEGVSCHLN